MSREPTAARCRCRGHEEWRRVRPAPAAEAQQSALRFPPSSVSRSPSRGPRLRPTASARRPRRRGGKRRQRLRGPRTGCRRVLLRSSPLARRSGARLLWWRWGDSNPRRRSCPSSASSSSSPRWLPHDGGGAGLAVLILPPTERRGAPRRPLPQQPASGSAAAAGGGRSQRRVQREEFLLCHRNPVLLLRLPLFVYRRRSRHLRPSRKRAARRHGFGAARLAPLARGSGPAKCLS